MAQQPNMNKMLKQLQEAQNAMAVEQEKLKTEIVEASAGGGMVTVKVTGDQVVTEINIDPQAVDPEDVEILQEMLLAATNEAIRSSQALAEQRLGGIAGGLGLPGM
jgi:DNA-binding YbaB/EbfC family protein